MPPPRRLHNAMKQKGMTRGDVAANVAAIDPGIFDVMQQIADDLDKFVKSFDANIFKKELTVFETVAKYIKELEKDAEKQIEYLKELVNVNKHSVNRMGEIFLTLTEMVEKITYLIIETSREKVTQWKSNMFSFMRKYFMDPWLDLWISIKRSFLSLFGDITGTIASAFTVAIISGVTASLSGIDALRLLPASIKAWILVLGAIPQDFERLNRIVSDIRIKIRRFGNNIRDFFVSLDRNLRIQFHLWEMSIPKYLWIITKNFLTRISKKIASFLDIPNDLKTLYTSIAMKIMKYEYGKYIMPLFDMTFLTIEKIKNFFDTISRYSNRIIETSETVINFIKKPVSFILKSIRILRNFFLTLNNILVKITSFISKSFEAIVTTVSKFHVFIRELGGIFKFFATISEFLTKVFKFIFGRFMFWFLMIWDFFEGFFRDWEKDVGFMKRVAWGISNMIRGLFFEPLNVLRDIFAWMLSFISVDAADWVRNNIDFVSFYNNYIAPILESPIETLVNTILPFIGEVFTSAITGTIDWFKQKLNSIIGEDKLGKIWEGMKNVLSWFIENSAVKWIIDTIKNLFSFFDEDPEQNAEKQAKSVIGKINDIITKVIDYIVEFFDWLFSTKSIKSMLKTVLDSSGIGNWIGGTDWILDKIFGKDEPAKPKQKNYTNVTKSDAINPSGVIVNNTYNNVNVVSPQGQTGGTVSGNIPVSTDAPSTASKMLMKGVGRN